MYYPIIDKLREVMARIDEGSSGSTQLININVNSQTGALSWEGNLSDIMNAMTSGITVYARLNLGDAILFVPIVHIVENVAATSCLFTTGTSWGYIRLLPNNVVEVSETNIPSSGG